MTVRTLCALVAAAAALPAARAVELPAGDPPLRYEIRVALDPDARTFEGHERIVWHNRGDAPVDRVPLHVYLNAFAHRGTTFWRESPEAGFGRFAERRFFEVHDDPWGWNELRAVRRDGPDGPELAFAAIAPDDGNPLDRTLFEVRLDRPVPPGGTLALAIDFGGRLPVPWARTGCEHGFCLVAQWFPKVAVLEPPGTRGARHARWNAHQFHAATEFYADFADFDVTIDVPEGVLVAATGVERPADGAPEREGWTRRRWVQRWVHDFAFVAGRDLAERTVEHVPAGRSTPVLLRAVLPAALVHQAPRSLDAAAVSLDVLGEAIGPYPYDTLTVVAPPGFAGRTAGMEYPTFITGGTADPVLDWPPRRDMPLFVEVTVMHEVAHQYFYGLLANDEREEGFLDEGFATYWEERIFERWAEDHPRATRLLGRRTGDGEMIELMLAFSGESLREPLLRRPTWLYEHRTHGAQIYARMAALLATAERRFGRPATDRVFAAYFRRHAFAHPGAADFLAAARAAGGEAMAALLAEEFAARRLPLYRVEDVDVRRFEVPRGRSGLEPEHLRDAAAPLAVERDGRVRVEVTDPGHVRGLEVAAGATRLVALAPVAGRVGSVAGDATLWETRVRLSGPGRDHLPVTVELRFDDGVVLRQRWDGRALWRRLRTVRPARLVDVRIDPEQTIVLDPLPLDDGRRVEPDRRFVRDWGLFLVGAAEWLVAAVGGLL
ncbi:MAG: hypothetical protein Kow0062_21130 [Acidobacteriota bacterium]